MVLFLKCKTQCVPAYFLVVIHRLKHNYEYYILPLNPTKGSLQVKLKGFTRRYMLQHIFGYVVPREIVVAKYWLQKLPNLPVMPSWPIKPEPETDVRVHTTHTVPANAAKTGEVQSQTEPAAPS